MIMSDFERLSEEIQRSLDGISNAVEMEAGDKLPNYVIRAFIKIEDAINETNQSVKEKKLTLSKQNSVSFNKLKQKLKKYLQSSGPGENNYEKQLATFRESPVWSEDEARAIKEAVKAQQKASATPASKKKKDASSSEDSGSGSDSSEEEVKKSKVAVKKAKAGSDDSESSSSSSSSDSDSSSDESSSGESSSEDEEEVNIFNKPREELTPA
jgi:hypothetical protein